MRDTIGKAFGLLVVVLLVVLPVLAVAALGSLAAPASFWRMMQ